MKDDTWPTYVVIPDKMIEITVGLIKEAEVGLRTGTIELNQASLCHP